MAFYTHGTITAVATVGLGKINLLCEKALEDGDTGQIKRVLETI